LRCVHKSAKITKQFRKLFFFFEIPKRKIKSRQKNEQKEEKKKRKERKKKKEERKKERTKWTKRPKSNC
jgi:hypothetical protein